MNDINFVIDDNNFVVSNNNFGISQSNFGLNNMSTPPYLLFVEQKYEGVIVQMYGYDFVDILNYNVQSSQNGLCLELFERQSNSNRENPARVDIIVLLRL